MGENKPKVIVIPAAPKNTGPTEQRQLRVAAYCRVSTKEEDQLNSYEAQKNYYTDKIMENKSWTMADIFADEGITGTSARKRADFMRMMKWCKQGKIDLILTKSVSRFARNTVDCLNYVRMLKAQGIAVYFEKENINSMDESTELLVKHRKDVFQNTEQICIDCLTRGILTVEWLDSKIQECLSRERREDFAGVAIFIRKLLVNLDYLFRSSYMSV